MSMHTTWLGSNRPLGSSVPVVLLLYLICATSLVVSFQVSEEEIEHHRPFGRFKREEVKAAKDPTTDEKNKTEVKATASNNAVGTLNCSDSDAINRTECSEKKGLYNDYVNSIIQKMSENRGMLMRTLYVTLGVTGIVVAYFVLRAFWLRRKHTKTRKYGVNKRHGDHRDMEMEPLGDGNDDDDDYTVFEANGRRK